MGQQSKQYNDGNDDEGILTGVLKFREEGRDHHDLLV